MSRVEDGIRGYTGGQGGVARGRVDGAEENGGSAGAEGERWIKRGLV